MGLYISKAMTTAGLLQQLKRRSVPVQARGHERGILHACTYKNTTPFVPPIHAGKVIKVYDGDTIHVASEVWPGQVYRFSIRMNGYDSAEMRTRDPAEKRAAIIARDALHAKVMGKIVTLKNVALEKYGRVLCDVFLDNESINQWMIDNHYGIVYDGGTKTVVDWDAYIQQRISTPMLS